MTTPTITELRAWHRDASTHDADCLWRDEMLCLIVAYRDMAIRAGMWPCVCKHAQAGHGDTHLAYFACLCAAYEPVTLEDA